jgi:hypothetical protein
MQGRIHAVPPLRQVVRHGDGEVRLVHDAARELDPVDLLRHGLHLRAQRGKHLQRGARVRRLVAREPRIGGALDEADAQAGEIVADKPW